MNQVFIVIRQPDLTYYGVGEIKGVYATREEAEVRARAVDPTWNGESWDPLEVGEWIIGEDTEC